MSGLLIRIVARPTCLFTIRPVFRCQRRRIAKRVVPKSRNSRRAVRLAGCCCLYRHHVRVWAVGRGCGGMGHSAHGEGVTMHNARVLIIPMHPLSHCKVWQCAAALQNKKAQWPFFSPALLHFTGFGCWKRVGCVCAYCHTHSTHSSSSTLAHLHTCNTCIAFSLHALG